MYIFWALIGFIFLYSDFKKSGIYKLALGASFLFCSITAFKYPQNYVLQTVSILFYYPLFYFLIKNIYKKEKEDKKKLQLLRELNPKTATVVKDIGKTLSIDGIGLVKVNNEIYSAKNITDKEIKKGKEVKIVSLENNILNVEVIK